jgi:tripartite motif-containing protein 59
MEAALASITCPICYEIFDRPKALPCTHAYCEAGLDSYFSSLGYHSYLGCPTCRENCSDAIDRRRISTSVEALPTSWLINQLIDEYKESIGTWPLMKFFTSSLFLIDNVR